MFTVEAMAKRNGRNSLFPMVIFIMQHRAEAVGESGFLPFFAGATTPFDRARPRVVSV